MTAPESNLPDDFSDVEEISRNSGRLRVTLEILAALLILVGIYYLFAPEQQIDLPPLQEKEIDPIIRTQIDAAQGDQPTLTEADGDAAREVIAAQRNGSDSMSLAEIDRLAGDYQQQGRFTDAYLLWFYAARQGHGEAAFALASLYDPNHFKPGNSLLTSADALQAYKWYSAAARQSTPQAAERLQALRVTLQAQADAGDMAARRQLLNWQ